MKIGSLIKELRLNKGLTQNEVALKLGISRSVLSQYENNLVDPTAYVVSKFAEFFEVSADYLLGLEDDFGAKVGQKNIIERPPYDITDKQLINFMKLYEVMTELQKAQVLGFVIGMLENAGINVKTILGY